MYQAAKTLYQGMVVYHTDVSELGVTLAQKSVESKSNEIPAVQELMKNTGHFGALFAKVIVVIACFKGTLYIKNKILYNPNL